MKKQYRDLTQKATTKSKENLKLECALPMAELIQGMSVEIGSFSAQLGLQIMRAVMEEEIESRLGPHGSQSHYRHGQHAGASPDADGGWERSGAEDDGKHLRKECAVVALGVTADGAKQVLGMWHGGSENSTTVKALLEDLVERGLCTSSSILVVLDGAKALRKAVRALFGERALIQRCRVHKRRNVLEHLPKEKQRQTLWRLKAAWAESDPDKAEAELRKIVKWLEATSPGAARSLEEGLEEILTVTRLGLHEDLIKTFASTNLIESCFSRTEQLLRWTGAALLFAEKGFRKVRGYRHLHQLSSSLKNQFLDGGQIAA